MELYNCKSLKTMTVGLCVYRRKWFQYRGKNKNYGLISQRHFPKEKTTNLSVRELK